MKWIKINESRYGSIKKLANGCKMRDMGDCFVVTDPNGKNIGQCRTEIEAETIAEEYGKNVNESSGSLVRKVQSSIPEDVKDSLVGCKFSPKDDAVLVVFAPGSTKDVSTAKKSLMTSGFEVESSKYKGYLVLQVSENLKNESLEDGFKTNKEVANKVDELVQAVWEDAKKEQKLEAFHIFEKNLSNAIADYWDRIA